jgi:hypothetical protein
MSAKPEGRQSALFCHRFRSVVWPSFIQHVCPGCSRPVWSQSIILQSRRSQLEEAVCGSVAR